MKLLFKQRLFSWFDSYDIYDQEGRPAYTVKGQLSWGHCLKIFDPNGNEMGMVKERVLTFLPKFEVYLGGQYLGCIQKEFSLFRPRYHIDFNGWQVQGNFMEWDYRIFDPAGKPVVVDSKEIFHLTDTYVIEVAQPQNALPALMFVLAVDAEKCSRN